MYAAPLFHDGLHRIFDRPGIGDIHFLEEALPVGTVSVTSHQATRQPSWVKRSAVARPMPAAAPVTITTLPCNPVSIIESSWLSLPSGAVPTPEP